GRRSTRRRRPRRTCPRRRRSRSARPARSTRRSAPPWRRLQAAADVGCSPVFPSPFRPRSAAVWQERQTTAVNRPEMSTSTAIERFLAAPMLAESTRRAYASDLRGFERWLEGRGVAIDEVDVRVLVDYASELGRARNG